MRLTVQIRKQVITAKNTDESDPCVRIERRAPFRPSSGSRAHYAVYFGPVSMDDSLSRLFLTIIPSLSPCVYRVDSHGSSLLPDLFYVPQYPQVTYLKRTNDRSCSGVSAAKIPSVGQRYDIFILQDPGNCLGSSPTPPDNGKYVQEVPRTRYTRSKLKSAERGPCPLWRLTGDFPERCGYRNVCARLAWTPGSTTNMSESVSTEGPSNDVLVNCETLREDRQ